MAELPIEDTLLCRTTVNSIIQNSFDAKTNVTPQYFFSSIINRFEVV